MFAISEMFEYGTKTPPHCRDREETGVIRPSAHVQVVGLQIRGDLNGSSAVVAGAYVVEKERWPVRFKSGEHILLKPSNIRVDARQPANVPSATDWLAANVPPGMTFLPKLPPMQMPGMPPLPSAEDQQQASRQAAMAMAVYAGRSTATATAAASAVAGVCIGGAPAEEDEQENQAVTGGFRPGDSVELIALSRAELNGTRAVCRVFDAGAGRWEVRMTAAGDTQKILKVKPSNLSSVTSRRLEAMNALSGYLRSQYPQRGFKLHPSIGFCADEDGSVCVRCSADVAAGEILLVVPDAVGISTRSAACSTELTLSDGTPMERVLAEVATRWRAREDEWVGVFGLQDAQLAVLLMHVTSHPLSDLHMNVAAAWPSLDDMRANHPVFWSAERLAHELGGSHVARLIKLVKDEVTRVIEWVIEPALSASCASSFLADGASIKDRFLYGVSLAYSRAHDSDTSDSSIGILRPLVDAINGLPGPHPAINVEVNRGKWPFLRGNVFRDDCNLKVSAVAAKRALSAGEELIIDYGGDSGGMFFLRYACVPRQLLSGQGDRKDAVECMIPADLKPAPSDPLRLHAVCEIFSFGGFESEVGFVLSMQDLEGFRCGLEPDSFKSLRQFCVLLVAAPREIQTFCACNGSRFRFNPEVTRIVEMMTRIFDHSLTALAPREGEHIMRRIERRGLQEWRTAVLGRYAPFSSAQSDVTEQD